MGTTCVTTNTLSSKGKKISYRPSGSYQLKALCSEKNQNDSIDRRDFFSFSYKLSMATASSSLLVPKETYAIDQERDVDKKPFAPLENLLPAIRVKINIEKATSLTKSLITNPSASNSSKQTLNELESILLKPQNYVQTLKLKGVPDKPADVYLDSYKPMKGDLPLQRFLIQSGDIDAWKRLKRREKEQERSNEIRAALNAYTDALSFSGDSYLLNVDKTTRSNMIREERLPGLKQVITSDMGMRYLYRNQVITAMDDVKAELEYQLLNENSRVDGEELLDLLVLADTALGRWLSLIDSDDVKAARALVESN